MLDRLRAVRQAAKVKQVQIARKLGISKQLYSAIERGQRRLTYDMAVAIARELNTTPDKIFLVEESTNPIPSSLTGTDGE